MKFVRNTIPNHTEQNVGRDRDIVIRFFSDMNEDTFTRQSVVLFNMDQQHTEQVSLKYQNKILTISPIELLQPKAHYKIMIIGGTTGVRDIVDMQMAETYTMEFFTSREEELKPPVVVEPFHRSIVDAPFKVKIQGYEHATYIRLQISDTHDFHKILYPYNEQLLPSQEVVEITPDLNLKQGTYYIRAASLNEALVQSEFTPALQIYTDGNFTEEEEILTPELPEVPKEPGEDVEEPEIPIEDIINGEIPPILEPEEEVEDLFRVLGLLPRKDMIHVPIANMKTIVVRFSEDIDPESVTNETIYVVAEKN